MRRRRKNLGRLYIRPQWVGWTGVASMAYVITSVDLFRDDSWIVEVSVSKPAMGNKWNFRNATVPGVIRRIFYDFVHDRRLAGGLSRRFGWR